MAKSRKKSLFAKLSPLFVVFKPKHVHERCQPPPLFITRANTAGIGNGIYLDCARVWEEKSGLTGVFNSCWVFEDK